MFIIFYFKIKMDQLSHLNALFPKLIFQIKKDYSFEKKRYIFYIGPTIYLVRSLGMNKYNILILSIEAEYINGKKTNYKDYEIFVVPEDLYDTTIYEIIPQRDKIQNAMEKRAIEKIIGSKIEYFSW